jgi:hypothetical protein
MTTVYYSDDDTMPTAESNMAASYCDLPWRVINITGDNRVVLYRGEIDPCTDKIEDLFVDAVRNGAQPRWLDWCVWEIPGERTVRVEVDQRAV